MRKWFNHESDKHKEFKLKYRKELEDGKQQEARDKLKEIVRSNNNKTTLLFGAKAEKYKQAQVLKA